MKDMSVMQLLPYVLLFITVSFAWPIADSATGPVAIRADLTHVDSGRGFTKRELLRRMAARSRARADKLCSPRGGNVHAVTVPAARGTTGKEDADSEYLVHFGIGTPHPQRVALTLDTGSDLIWTQCECTVCFDQPFPLLDTSASATGRGLSCFDPLCGRGGLPFSGCAYDDNVCFYVYSYGDKSVTAGKILEDTFTFHAPDGQRGTVATVPNLRFGCGKYNTGIFKSNESGIAGFGRGPLSLPSQLKVRRFSYCFTTIVDGRASPVFLGTPDNLGAQATGPIQATPFVPNPSYDSTLYYLSLKGITVGKTRLPFDASTFALKGDGVSGTIIDSGTGMTTFPEAVFRSIWKAFASQVPLPAQDAGGTLCFATTPKTKAPAVPKLILHLEGADWDLPRENYMLHFDDDDDGTGGGLCLVIGSSGEGNNMTVIGNFQQQNTHIVYDLEANKMVFLPARCDKL